MKAVKEEKRTRSAQNRAESTQAINLSGEGVKIPRNPPPFFETDYPVSGGKHLSQEGLPTPSGTPGDLLSHRFVGIFSLYHLAEHPLDARPLSITIKWERSFPKSKRLWPQKPGITKVFGMLAQQPDLPAWRADQLRGLAKKWRRLRRMPFSARLDFIENELTMAVICRNGQGDRRFLPIPPRLWTY